MSSPARTTVSLSQFVESSFFSPPTTEDPAPVFWLLNNWNNLISSQKNFSLETSVSSGSSLSILKKTLKADVRGQMIEFSSRVKKEQEFPNWIALSKAVQVLITFFPPSAISLWRNAAFTNWIWLTFHWPRLILTHQDSIQCLWIRWRAQQATRPAGSSSSVLFLRFTLTLGKEWLIILKSKTPLSSIKATYRIQWKRSKTLCPAWTQLAIGWRGFRSHESLKKQ